MLEKITGYADTVNAFFAQYAERFSAWYGGLSEMAQLGVLIGGAIGVMILIALFALSRLTR
jgi:ABC-type multidrug transport system permease subunit